MERNRRRVSRDDQGIVGGSTVTPEQEQQLTEKLTQLGYPDFDVMPGEDSILMLHIDGHLISSADYALSLSDETLKSLIDETVQSGGQG